MDISSDLTEFAKSPVAVVCAGAKSILDIPRTLEYLETMVMPPSDMQSIVCRLQVSFPEPQTAHCCSWIGTCQTVSCIPCHPWELYATTAVNKACLEHRASRWLRWARTSSQRSSHPGAGVVPRPAWTPRRRPPTSSRPRSNCLWAPVSSLVRLSPGSPIFGWAFLHHPDSQAQERRQPPDEEGAAAAGTAATSWCLGGQMQGHVSCRCADP